MYMHVVYSVKVYKNKIKPVTEKLAMKHYKQLNRFFCLYCLIWSEHEIYEHYKTVGPSVAVLASTVTP
jgi:hypothetical protein